MNKTRFLILLATFILASLACNLASGLNGATVSGSGNVVEEAREVSGVTGVNLATIGDLTIEVGDTESLRIEAEDNLMEYFETEVRNGKLTIGTKNNVQLQPTKPIRYYLRVTGLDTLEISSAGNIEAPDLEAGKFSMSISSAGDLEMGNLEADTLNVNISSSGNVSMGELNAGTLEVDIGSSGNLDISGGEVKSQNIKIGSSGNYTAQDLASDVAEVRLSSNGSATIWVRDQLKVDLSSSGDLRYRGDPIVDATTSSAGEVIQIGE